MVTTPLAAIEKAAKEATPGPWKFLPRVGYLFGADEPTQYGPGIVQIGTIGAFHDAELLEFNRERWVADGTFIALANPATILALCERIRELEKLMPARSK